MHALLTAALLVTLNGSRVPDAEICGVRALGTETPFRQQLASSDIVCGGNFAPGLWNLFARRGTSLISGHTVLVDTRKPTADIELRLEPAATVVFPSRPAGAFVYVTDTLSAFPASPDGRALIPAERDAVPLLARDAVPLAIGEPVHVAAGATKAVANFSFRGVATWLSIAPADLEALRTARRKQPPHLVPKPVNPLRGTVEIDGAMQFIREVPAGPATIEIGGAPWKHVSASVNVPASGIVLTAAPLMLVPTSSAVVKWMARRSLADLVGDRNPPCPGAKKPKTPEMKPVVSLLTCKRDDCTAVGQHEWPRDEQIGSVLFDNLDPGTYTAEFTFADLPPVDVPVKVGKFEQVNVPLDVDYTTLYGRVTVAGEKVPGPVAIRFRFVNPVWSDADGNYSVVLNTPLTAERVISVRSCDGSVDGEVIVDRDVLPNSRYDIDLSANRVTIEAADAETGAPISGALVRYGAFRTDEMSSTYYFRLAFGDDNVPERTDAEGKFVVEHMPPGKILRVCLEHDDYERTCPEPFELTSNDEQTLKIAMKPKGFRGRIAGVTNVSAGQLYWFSADGFETERTAVKDDGTFRYRNSHEPGQVAVFVSANLPLFAFLQPQLAAGEAMTVPMPSARSRTFIVSIGEESAQTDGLVTIAIGGLVVPYPPFAQHLALHGSQLAVTNRGPLLVPDILETAPLFAILGPPLAEVTPEMRRIDLFRLPQFRSLPRKPVGADGRIVFAMLTPR